MNKPADDETVDRKVSVIVVFIVIFEAVGKSRAAGRHSGGVDALY